uniref:Uncharacterized protein n=1 Tax=Globisporangium ultimum (strain ATCC 200006 / CBS 805.95 / DAOM BR144) TaxID=431595 RepID=K3X251_GLOUD
HPLYRRRRGPDPQSQARAHILSSRRTSRRKASMGATLGCYRGPDSDLELFAARYLDDVHGAKKHGSASTHSMSFQYMKSRPPLYAKESDSVLEKLQRTLSLSILKSRPEASGRRSNAESGDEFGHDPASWDVSQSYSSASGTSGSRMLSDFYNLVLECDRNTFFKDKQGKRVKGAYLDEILIIDDYFGVMSRKRQRTEKQTDPKLSLMDRFSSGQVPAGLMSTTSTLSSEMDYWSCFDSAADQDELDLIGMRTTSFQSQQHHGNRHSYYGASSSASTNGLLLFSPMHADAAGDVSTGRVSKSLSPHNNWAGYGGPYGYDEEDEDDEDDQFSRSAYGYHLDQFRQHQQMKQQQLKPLASVCLASAKSDKMVDNSPSARTSAAFSPPNAAQNASAVVPMIAS